MPTIPTGKMELELRRLYFRWLSRLGDETNMDKAVDRFEKQSIDLIEKMGGRTAMLGALADFPAPKRLDLSPHIGTIYSDMKQAAIQAGIQAGLNASDVARHMLRAGMDKSYNRLNRLARTETVSAYWKNAWNSIEDLPELVMIWGSEDGPRTCAWCRERDGMVMESSQLRDHPNGRCTPIPTLRSMVEYKGSVRADGQIYQDPAWAKKPESKPSFRVPSQNRPHVDVSTAPEYMQSKLMREWRFYDGTAQTDTMWSYDYDGLRALQGATSNLRAGLSADSGLDLTRFTKKAGFDFYEDTIQTLAQDQVLRALELAAQDLLSRTPVALPSTVYRGMYVPAGTEFKAGSSVKLDLSSFAKNEATVGVYTTKQTIHGFDDGFGVIMELRNSKGLPIQPDANWDEMLVTGEAIIESVDTSGKTVRVVATYVGS